MYTRCNVYTLELWSFHGYDFSYRLNNFSNESSPFIQILTFHISRVLSANDRQGLVLYFDLGTSSEIIEIE